MRLKLPILLLFLLMMSFSFAQKNHWSEINENDINQEELLETHYQVKVKNTYHLNFDSIKADLSRAPFRFEASESTTQVSLPDENGELTTYSIFKIKTLAEGLSDKYPEINSYIGFSSKKALHSLRITTTPQGFYAMVLRPGKGTLMINPLTRDAEYYTAFNKKYTSKTEEFHYCNFEGEESDFNLSQTSTSYETFSVDDATLRTYDLALASTGEYSQFHINQAGLSNATEEEQTTAVLAAMTVAIDRVNTLYEKDVAVRFQLIDDTDLLINLNPNTDPYTNSSGPAMLGQNQQQIDSVIGNANYHVGHVFSTGGGGIASLASVCVSNYKARGVTGLPSPIGDPFYVDFVSHELGHQFGANHTFNNFCGGARSSTTSVEPGSGNTIMAYAGICPPNVQSGSDDHFHQMSITEIYNNITNGQGAGCPTTTTLSNSAPVITTTTTHTIPNATAFYLDATATDADNDALTYNWEQNNKEFSTQPPQESATQGPNFKSSPSTTDSKRYFPRFQEVLNNNLTPTWEVVPSVERTMDFTLTVRDNNSDGGQSSREDVSVNFKDVGPFQVISQNEEDINWLPGETETITWDVAGTTANAIDTDNVNILLSTDNGENFDTVLASNVPNDGSYDITVPDTQATFCRLKIEPTDNIYYALNASTFAIDTSIQTSCETYTNEAVLDIPDGAGSNQQGTEVTSVITVPEDTEVDDLSVAVNISHALMGDVLFQLTAPNGETTVLWNRNCAADSINVSFNANGNNLPTQGYNCSSAVSGTFASFDGTLDDLTTGSVQGDWTLTLADFYTGDTGTLNAWSIEMCSTSLGVDEQRMTDFTISPNPTHGKFTLNTSQLLSQDASAQIYSIQGQVIETINLSNQSTTHEIQLSRTLQSGIYLIEITDGQTKSIEKLIVR